MIERKIELNEFLNKLDETCSFILAEIIQNPKGIGFNELYRRIKKHSECRTMAKSTLSDHIKHLVDQNFIERKTVKDSPLKLKPVQYRTSQHFRKLSKGMIAQSVSPEDFLPLMRKQNASEVTNQLMSAIFTNVTECLKAILQAPENISRLNMHQAFYIMETLMIAYRKRILESKDEITALKTIDEWFALSNRKIQLSS